MIGDFIGGGQIFLHKIRMFVQVLRRSFFTAFLLSTIIISVFSYKNALLLIDFKALVTFQKALIVDSIDNAASGLRKTVKPHYEPSAAIIDAYTDRGLYARNIEAKKILRSAKFNNANKVAINFLIEKFIMIIELMCGIFFFIYIAWSRLGKEVKQEKHISGSTVKTAREVSMYLRFKNKASSFKIGSMPIVKDSESKHIMVTGSTGAGKTNLLNNFLPQIIHKKQPAIVIDQTGEMIARYYNVNRGDIIFNPLDQRSHGWDFWGDNCDKYRLEKFAKVLFKYGKNQYSGSDPFWDNSAEVVFTACVEYLIQQNKKSFDALDQMLRRMSIEDLNDLLKDSQAARYLGNNNKTTASSILSVLATKTKPISLLSKKKNLFSIKKYFEAVNQGNPAWLFLSSPPDLREVTMPLLSALFELSISNLIGIGESRNRRIWFIIDELASLGNLSGFSTLMLESRKYGGCVLAATQSMNQLFENFGRYSGNTIFSQFATKFMFRSDDPTSSKIISDTFGNLEYSHQQKNTSFGANEFRDGISYTVQQKRKSLIQADDLASLADNECYVGLPEPKIRIAKIKVPIAKGESNNNPGFLELANERNEDSSPKGLSELLTIFNKVDSAIETPKKLDKENESELEDELTINCE